jgi:hypothetical protein
VAKREQMALAIGREHGNWKPKEWTAERKIKFIRHVSRYALRAAASEDVPHSQNLVLAEVSEFFHGSVSAAMLNALGVKTIGEVNRNG